MKEKIKILRKSALTRRQQFTGEQLKKPIAFWTKEDRLLDKKGKELTIILRTKGCRWALGENGGCSMCGYIQDSCSENVSGEYIKNQFDYAFRMKLEEIQSSHDQFVIKIFNSGSFFDDAEIPVSIREYIYREINKINNIKEVVVESRVEYISKEKLESIKNSLKEKYIEVAIGLESVNDHIRNQYINKGLLFEDFLQVVKTCKDLGIGIRVYLIFKPPFLNEQSAIEDCFFSLQKLISLKVNTISINPVNIQRGTLVEHLWYQKRYRPPWFYSLIKCLLSAYKQIKNINSVRIISDPSGAGTKRGIHNCLKRDCNEKMIKALNSFVLTQDINYLKDVNETSVCNCRLKYHLQKNYI